MDGRTDGRTDRRTTDDGQKTILKASPELRSGELKNDKYQQFKLRTEQEMFYQNMSIHVEVIMCTSSTLENSLRGKKLYRKKARILIFACNTSLGPDSHKYHILSKYFQAYGS